MKQLAIILLLSVFSSSIQAQAPEIWGTAKSTVNSSNYIIYKTDTALGTPLAQVKILNATFDGIPNGNLVKGNYDTLIYGVTNFSVGISNIFQINTATNAYTVKFQTTTAAQGIEIVGELVKHPNGKYYGMTNGGGASNKGVIFEWDPLMNTYTVKHDFNGTNGAYPRSNASLRYCASDGYFYGLTLSGGASNYGVLFRYNATTNAYQVVNNFTYSNGIEPNGSVQILEYPNGDLNILYTLMFGSSNNWGALCNTLYTASSGIFTSTYHSFSGLYFYNNTLNLNNPRNDLVKLKYNNGNNHAQYIGVAANSLQNSHVIYSFAVNSTTKQIYTNTAFQFTSTFPTHASIRTADNFVQSDFASGAVFGVTNGLDEFNPNGSFLRKYYPLNGTFASSVNIQSIQNLSNEVFGGRPYVHTYTPCVPASAPIVISSSSNVCFNNPVTLTITSGSLNTSTNWTWYAGNCGGNPIGTGTSITVNQNTTTTYYVRGEGGCSTNGNCGSVTVNCVPPNTELFFSEYIEGSSSNKALEIFNPTSSTINLSGYKVELYINGASTPTNTQQLSGNLAAGDVYVIANAAATAPFTSVADITSSVCNFNGDDAVVLKKNNVSVDIIGVVGVDPGVNWLVSNGGATSGFTLVRDSAITGPETVWAVAQNQWYAYPANTSSYLGSHAISNTNTGIPDFNEWNGLKIYPNPGSGWFKLESTQSGEINILNSLGMVVYRSMHSGSMVDINLSNLPAGMYLIRVGDAIARYLKW
ncbi:MAG: choice-of-anchor tandem repeat GloVer-containing protein [Bacteroidota bacterium]